MTYDYRRAVTDDVKQWLTDHADDVKSFEPNATYDDVKRYVYDRVYNLDEITGNASGSYTFNYRVAEENLCGNLGLLADTLDEFEYTNIDVLRSPETCDVLIRIYLLPECIPKAFDELSAESVNDEADNDEADNDEADNDEADEVFQMLGDVLHP